MYLYRQTEGGLWTVGCFPSSTEWYSESDHDTKDAAAARVHYLNGGVHNELNDIAEALLKIAHPLLPVTPDPVSISLPGMDAPLAVFKEMLCILTNLRDWYAVAEGGPSASAQLFDDETTIKDAIETVVTAAGVK